jgi:hypothetical protein
MSQMWIPSQVTPLGRAPGRHRFAALRCSRCWVGVVEALGEDLVEGRVAEPVRAGHGAGAAAGTGLSGWVAHSLTPARCQCADQVALEEQEDGDRRGCRDVRCRPSGSWG